MKNISLLLSFFSKNQVIITILSFICGAIISGLIGSLVGSFKPNNDSFILAVFIIIMFFLSGILLCIAFLIKDLEGTKEIIRRNYEDTKEAKEFIQKNLENIIETKELVQKVGINFRYISKESGAREELFKQAKKFIEQSRQNIYALTYFSSYSDSDDKNKEISADREEYYNAIEKAIDREVKYERILQIDTHDQKELKTYLGVRKGFTKHIKNVLSKNKYGSNIKIIEADISLLTTFVLIDEKYLIWEVEEQEKNVVDIYGIFVIEDHQKQVTGEIKELFSEIIKRKKSRLLDIMDMDTM